jgi:hypothetical protein
MSTNMQLYAAALLRCEAVASDHGHALSTWYPVDERLHASLCVECGEMVWVSRSRQDKGWRLGGRVLRQDCPGEEFEVGLVPS